MIHSEKLEQDDCRIPDDPLGRILQGSSDLVMGRKVPCQLRGPASDEHRGLSGDGTRGEAVPRATDAQLFGCTIAVLAACLPFFLETLATP